MIRHRFFVLSSILFVVFGSANFSQQNTEQTTKLRSTLVINYNFISVNNLLMYFSNNGDMSNNNLTLGPGLEYPVNSGKYLVFEDGLLWGGNVVAQSRVGGSTYRHGLQPGTIDASTGDAADPTDPKYRIYKVRKVTPSTFASMSSSEQNRLRQDYNEWATSDGAPFTDRDGIAGYQPDFNKWLNEQTEPDKSKRKTDEPLFLGDEVAWFVSNDKDPTLTNYLYGSPPIGIELQTMIWAIKNDPVLENVIFVKQMIIHKGTNPLTNAYISKWVDPDLGDANDDFVGIDTTIGLAYTYNGKDVDGVYQVPPAVGYLWLQGPAIKQTGSTGFLNLRERTGIKNLPISAYAFYINGSSIYKDPLLGDPAGTTEILNYMRGMVWDGSAFIDPTTSKQTKIPLAGNPFTKTGWVDSLVAPAGDRRFMMSAGPFTIQRPDTQEVIYAVIAAQGTNRMNSLEKLFQYAQTVKQKFRSIITTDVADNNIAPRKFMLMQNYPNPFGSRLQTGSPSTTISFSITERKHIRLKVYDIFMRDVATLLNEERDAGYYNVTFNAHDLPSGTYFYKLEAGTFTKMRKMNLVQ